jgi:hypothetical protein
MYKVSVASHRSTLQEKFFAQSFAEIKKRSVKTPEGKLWRKVPIKYFSLPEKRGFSLRKREEDMKFFYGHQD